MSLLTICQNAADEVGTFERPDQIIGSTDPAARKLLRYSNKVSTMLMRRFPWQAIRKQKEFAALGQEEQTDILPDDFDRFVPETFWNREDSQLFIGPVTAAEWQASKAKNYSGTAAKFTYRQNSILMLPPPDAGDATAFEYVSKNWCQSAAGVEQAAWADDTDTGILDEEMLTYGLVWSYLENEGQNSTVALAEFQDYVGLLTANEISNNNIMATADIFRSTSSRHWTGEP